jgi:hypothetical protein
MLTGSYYTTVTPKKDRKKKTIYHFDTGILLPFLFFRAGFATP